MTIVKGLRYGVCGGDLESLTELHVQINGKDYYVLISDIGEEQKVTVSDTPLMDEYLRIDAFNVTEHEAAYNVFKDAALYTEDKSAEDWYDVEGKEFESAVKLAAMASVEHPYGEEIIYAPAADAFISEYLEKDIDNLDLPITIALDDEDDDDWE